MRNPSRCFPVLFALVLAAGPVACRRGKEGESRPGNAQSAASLGAPITGGAQSGGTAAQGTPFVQAGQAAPNAAPVGTTVSLQPPAPAPSPLPLPLPVPSPSPSPPPAAPSIKVSGWFAYWSTQAGFDSAAAGAGVLGHSDLFWYYLDAQGGLVGKGGNAGQASVITTLRNHGHELYLTVADFSTARTRPVMNDAALRANNVKEIVAAIQRLGLDGVDVDFEGLTAQDAPSLVAYISELSAGVHAAGKKISVTVMPKWSSPGLWGSQIAYDYKALGAKVDELKIMSYNQHYSGGSPGAIASPDWIEKILRFAVTEVDPRKVSMGMPFYGYDWAAGGKGAGVTWASATDLALRFGVTPGRDPLSGEMGFSYVDGGVSHTVWYQDGEALARKAAVAKKVGVGGIAVWKLGEEEPGSWDKIRKAIQ